MGKITTEQELHALYGTVSERAAQKVLLRLDKHCRKFIAHSPLMFIGSDDGAGAGDVTPKGDPAGFVEVLDDRTIAIPDRPGNNRLDTWLNILKNPAVGLLFVVPGMNEILRINGVAEIRDDEDLRERFVIKNRLPTSVLVVKIDHVYFHCAKALVRSKLWDVDQQIDRSIFPSLGQILKDQVAEKSDHDTSSWDTTDQYVKELY